MTRWTRREDPAYLAAMREAKILFDAEMAKSVMKKGRPAGVKNAPKAVEKDADEDDAEELVIVG